MACDLRRSSVARGTRRAGGVLLCLALLTGQTLHAWQPGVQLPGAVLEENVAVPMRDGVVLRADVWRPAGPGPFPVLVYRTPYGKDGVLRSFGLYRKAVERGYAVVTQDVRGRYHSDGVFLPYQQEGKDGYDTIEWAAAQPWSNGRVGTVGLSYPGAVQWLAAVESPPSLKAMVPAMTFASARHFWYAGNVWDASWIPWIWNSIAPDLRKRAGIAGPQTGAEARAVWAEQGRPLQEVRPLGAMSAFRGIADWYYEWMRHPANDPWWDWADLTKQYGRTSAAVLNLSAWHDDAYGPAGATGNFMGLVGDRGPGPRTRLLMGPWIHGVSPMVRSVTGHREMGPDAVFDYDETVLRWMDRWVREIDNGVDREPPVRVFVMGENRWRTASAWPIPEARSQSLYLSGPGRLSGDTLTAGAPSTSFVSDPAHPVRDPWAEQSGAHDYRALVGREDVLIFETEPLGADLTVIGAVEAEVYLSIDVPDTDLWIKLFDVAPDGTAWNLMSPGLDVIRASYREGGVERSLLEQSKVYRLQLPNMLTSNRFKAGHRIRIAVMTSFAPHLSHNLHTGELEFESSVGRTARVTIHHGPGARSRIILPVVPNR